MNNLYTLDQICKKITDGSHQSPKEDPTGYPMVSVKDMTEFGFDLSKAKHISKNDFEKLVKQGCKPEVDDILIAKDGSVMKHIFRVRNADNIVLLSSIAILRPNKEIVYPDFLVYSLKNNRVKEDILNNYVSGSGVPRIVLKDFKKVELDIPNLDLQINISKKLRSLDDKIELNTQINQTLEQIAQALFKSWFVDFDPVRAKVQALSDGLSLEQAELAAMQAISGKTPEELTALSQTQPDRYAELSKTAKAFPCEMVEIDGVEVPKGWLVSTISECSLKIQNGGTPKRSNLEYWENGDISWLSSGEVCNNKVLVQSKEYITDLGLKGSAAKLIPPYSTLVAIYASPTAGKCAFSGFETSTNQAVCAIIPKEEYTFFNYYHLQLQEKYFANQASGSAQQNISKKIIEETPVLIPNKVILKKFNLLAKPIMNKTIENLKENNNLERKRDLLLPKLLNGEV
ncbi:restriction endonuclease subunit S [Haemophilus parahaemolyticus]|uniref:Restriction endonuclease subunit S n=2 Tax=Haemophilus parahaemolyticus TaxID=735 RepID=A0AAE6JQ33_HAEPH|nr:restriction endonuclease subunit S [Haemophilus parahaemolyticus]EIJ69958.1 type I restriction modification DNA specificity domain protein [Haemophilus parahaemolyticus HK385]OOR97935.1 hypothetical protein B0185_03845 [Haemophilus parahaemolyticus]QEN10315.1 restriction endonuclease subunit S [Haemophilus parahaemolyticus]QRP13303.1 restriction endonuclease subunit S [Haemophilus parahaemolyticus]STO65825.1 type I restriction/modification specificity protein [Haemophilus parahaemolyticus H